MIDSTPRFINIFAFLIGVIEIGVALPQTNLLLLSFDGLRTDLSVYGNSLVSTPNFERLAKMSLAFDHAFAQGVDKKSSWTSLLTGLRPDSVSLHDNHSISQSFWTLSSRLRRLGYLSFDAGISSIDMSGANTATSNPWHVVTNKAIDTLTKYHRSGNYFILTVDWSSFLHDAIIPSKYFDIYDDFLQSGWVTSNKARRFPRDAPVQSFPCCVNDLFRDNQGHSDFKSRGHSALQSISDDVPQTTRTQLMRKYSAAISYADYQLGRILDSLDQLDLWKNVTVVLTSSHGATKGEKGIWDRWSLFDESSHVPLFIAHPESSLKGQHYSQPVELIDLLPTMLDLSVGNRKLIGLSATASESKFFPLQGKSLALTVLGNASALWRGRTRGSQAEMMSPRLGLNFALTQKLLCASMDLFDLDPRTNNSAPDVCTWYDCDLSKAPVNEVSAIGYSLRTLDFRYTAWIPVDRVSLVPMWSVPALAEELYDHRHEKESSPSTSEINNVADEPAYRHDLSKYRQALTGYLRKNVVYCRVSVMCSGIDGAGGSPIGTDAKNGYRSNYRDNYKITTGKGAAQRMVQGYVGAQHGRPRGKRAPLSPALANVTAQTNLLFIIFDDLRPELSIYGKSHMITPNFERLARRSVVFDNVYAQVSVCNPSRDSLLTGLRPDTVGTLNFFSTYDPHMILPLRLLRSGYQTFGYGKIRHWEHVPEAWVEHWDGDWYAYQNYESEHMNSTVMPDKNTPEASFPDYNFTTLAIEKLRLMAKEKQDFFMLGVGFKMPHASLHVPFRTFDMYRSRSKYVWKTPVEERGFPRTAPVQAYRCCTTKAFQYMNKEGAKMFTRELELEKIEFVTPQDMYTEIMWGYSAAVSFVDEQLGRILDVLDELDLWKNLTVVLTADHGMHNGEKGIWEKWSLFDESTRVPLLVAHPESPMGGQRYSDPVELIDVFPTIIDLLGAPFNKTLVYDAYPGALQPRKYVPVQGKSLASFILGNTGVQRKKFAISQVLKCALIKYAEFDPRTRTSITEEEKQYLQFYKLWSDCKLLDKERKVSDGEVPIMGYSMRTLEYRYTAWMHLNHTTLSPIWSAPLITEELYDHRDEAMSDLGHLETVNLAVLPKFENTVVALRSQLMDFLVKEVVYARQAGFR